MTVVDRAPDAELRTILAFLRRIGIRVGLGPVAGALLPGVTVERGSLLVDRTSVVAPGDILHEAGHLAVMAPDRRPRTTGRINASPAEEMMAIAWSYAACVHLGLPPAVVFHADGYRGGSQALIDNFSAGRYVGVPMLDWVGMTVDPARSTPPSGSPFPVMARWLRGPGLP